MNKQNKRAFTLIELLVVVLIIGILAAVALPQYQKAVHKARWAEAQTNLKTLDSAVKACEMAHGSCGYCSLSLLDVELSTTENFEYDTVCPDFDEPTAYLYASYQKNDDQGGCLCYSPKTNQWATGNDICHGGNPPDYWENLLGIKRASWCECC